MNNLIELDAHNIMRMIRARGGKVLPHHEAQAIALVLDIMIARSSYLWACMDRKEVPTKKDWKSFWFGWRNGEEEKAVG